MIDGEDVSGYKFGGEVTDVPDNFKAWVRDNQDRIERARSKPYFLTDNEWAWKRIVEREMIGKRGYEKKAVQGAIFTDPLQVNSFLKLYDFMQEKALPKVREIAFVNMLKYETYKRIEDVFIMQGAKYNETELQTAKKLAKAVNGYYVVFPGEGHLKSIIKHNKQADNVINDVYLYDKKTYFQRKADLKAVSGGSVEAIRDHVIKGSNQAGVVVMDINKGVKRQNLIDGIRLGWGKETKSVIVNWKGQWYYLDKKIVFDKNKGKLYDMFK